jgi:hypothetical protein
MGLLVGASAATLMVGVYAFVSTDSKTSAAAKEQANQVLAQAVGHAVEGAVAFEDQTSTEHVLETFGAEPTTRFAAVLLSDNYIAPSATTTSPHP